MTEATETLFGRDPGRLRQEIASFCHEELLGQTSGHLPDAAGNLALHLAGNLRTYNGLTLGNQPYVKDRPAESASRNVAMQEQLRQIEHTKAVMFGSLLALREKDLAAIYPEEVLGYKMTTGFFLMHLLAHLFYHLGQINYLRRVSE